MTLTTTFVNKTTVVFKLKEGDDGVYKEICTLEGVNAEPPEKNWVTLEFDHKSTYKEYRVVERVVASSSRSGRVVAPVKILINSDFVLDNSTIYIVPDPNNPQNVIIKGDPRPDTPRVSGLWIASKIFSFFKRN